MREMRQKAKKKISVSRRGPVSARPDINKRYIAYVRDKVNQLLKVMGTLPLKPEELDDNTLLQIDPIGIIAHAFEQILEHLRETNRELTLARDELQAIFDATGVGISIIDTDFRILKGNEKQRKLLVDGDSADVTGRYCYEVYCDKSSPGLDCPAVDTFATGRSVILREVKKKDKHFQIVTTPLKDSEGNVTGVIEVLLDITEKKIAEDMERELRGSFFEERSKFDTVIQNLSDGLSVTDKNGAIISFNQAAQSMTGYSESEVLGLGYKEFFGMLYNTVSEIPIPGEDFKNTEFPIRSKDNRQLILSVAAAPVKSGKGENIGKIFTFRDVTEERQRQEAYFRTEKLAALGQLSAGVAHELNTPLGSILGYARLLLKDKELIPRQKERLEIIAEQAKRGSDIIRGLLSFARKSNPAFKTINDVDVNGIIQRVIKLLKTETVKRAIVVLTDLGDVPPVRIDIRQLEQVVFNIVLNAVQAIKNNGEVRIRTFYENNTVKIVVKDDGPGIAEDIKPRIFDPFFTTKPVGMGTGLGLAICSGIISEYGGSIHAESAEEKGAAFIITLPLHDPDARTP